MLSHRNILSLLSAAAAGSMLQLMSQPYGSLSVQWCSSFWLVLDHMTEGLAIGPRDYVKSVCMHLGIKVK